MFANVLFEIVTTSEAFVALFTLEKLGTGIRAG